MTSNTAEMPLKKKPFIMYLTLSQTFSRIFRNAKKCRGWVQIQNCPNPKKQRKTEKARQADASLHPPVSLCPRIKGFPGKKRKKVHRLLYHSLCTNVANLYTKDAAI